MPAGVKAPVVVEPKGLPAEKGIRAILQFLGELETPPVEAIPKSEGRPPICLIATFASCRCAVLPSMASRVHVRTFKRFLVAAIILSATAMIVWSQCKIYPTVIAPGGIQLSFFGMTVHYPPSLASEASLVQTSIYRTWDMSPKNTCGVTWSCENPSAGVYDFSALDLFLNSPYTQGKDYLYTFSSVPTWISSNATGPCSQITPGSCYPPTDIATGNTTFKNFATAVVNHSLASKAAGHGYIKYYEVWNEPSANDTGGGNCPPSCGTWNGTMAQFLIMASTEASVIHALDPNAQLVGPAQSHCGDATDKINFMNAWFAGGGGNLTNAISCHAYEGIAAPGFSLNVSISNVRAEEAANNVVPQPIWFTEGDCEESGTPCTSDSEKIAFIGQQTIMKLAYGVSRDIYYAWDGTHGDNLWDAASGVHADGKAYNILENWLIGSTNFACSQNGNSGFTLTTWTCNLKQSNGNPAQILFLAQNNIIHAPITRSVSAGKFTHYLSLTDTTVRSVSGGTVSIGPTPIMLTP